MQSNELALPPDYSVFQGCSTDLCNADLLTHYAIPNLSPGVLEGGDKRGGRGRGDAEGRGLRWAPPPDVLGFQPPSLPKRAPWWSAQPAQMYQKTILDPGVFLHCLAST